MRLLFLISIFTAFTFGSSLRIVGAVPFGSSSLRLEADGNIKVSDVNVHSAKGLNFVDVRSTLAFSKREYKFANNTRVTIVQNDRERVRILLSLNENTTFEHTISSKYLYIVIKDKLPIQGGVQPHKHDSSCKARGSPPECPIPKDKNHTDQVKPRVVPKPVLVSKSSSRSNAKSGSKVHKKVVMIDPGHGGKDCGSVAITGVCEKNIVLPVAIETAKFLERKGYVVYITRNKDYFIELRDRTEMANDKKVDLFVSIHANSTSKGSGISGIETYFLSTARTERALAVAEAENKGDIETMNYYLRLAFLNTLSSHRLILSNKLAIDIQMEALNSVRKVHRDVKDGGVREGPFWVLAGALMPSVLIEVGYNSNPREANRLLDRGYQRLLAEGIASGIDSFFAKNPTY